MNMRSSTVTTLAADSEIRGDLKIGGHLVVHGRVEGRGTVGSILTIGARGVWDGDVEAPFVYVDGVVTGSVVAAQQIVVGPRGWIQGWVRTARLKVQEGGRIDGEVLVGKAQVHAMAPERRRREGETAPTPRRTSQAVG